MKNIARWGGFALALAAPMTFGTPARAQDAGGQACDCSQGEEGACARIAAARPFVFKRAHAKSQSVDLVDFKILGLNDFHGQMSAGKFVGVRPVGNAAVLASYLRSAARDYGDNAILVHAGDQVGASPAASALLQDEPSISFLNIMNKKLGGGHGRSNWQVIGTLGNHEFDEGTSELFRLLDGGNHANGPFLDPHWGGADFPYVNCNVLDVASNKGILPASKVRKVDGVKIGFVGAVTKTTPTIVTPAGVAGLSFVDEADAINAEVAKLKGDGVHTIIVLIHEGGGQTSFTGPRPITPGTVSGPIVNIVQRLDDDVDLVVSGHSHQFTNTVILNNHSVPIVVTQAFSASTAYADIKLTVGKSTQDVTQIVSAIVTTWADDGPGLNPDADVAALTKAAEDSVAPLVNQVIGTAATAMTRTVNSAGESNLGDLIADAQRDQMHTDFAFMNPGGVRADLPAGTTTWGTLFAIQPFGNSMVKMDLTGAQIDAVLEQQWQVLASGRILHPSGLTYTWDNNLPVGSRVSDIRKNGSLIDPAATYTVAVNSFLSTGGDGFTVFNAGLNKVGGPVDLDALIAYVKSLAQPYSAPATNRITRLN